MNKKYLLVIISMLFMHQEIWSQKVPKDSLPSIDSRMMSRIYQLSSIQQKELYVLLVSYHALVDSLGRRNLPRDQWSEGLLGIDSLFDKNLKALFSAEQYSMYRARKKERLNRFNTKYAGKNIKN